MLWDYQQPVAIRFGNGRVREIKDVAAEMGLTEGGLLVSERLFAKNGTAERIVKDSEGAISEIFSEFSPNPDVTEVDKAAALIREKNLKFVVAMGGGSAMDLAKSAASIALTDDSIADYHGTGKAMPREHLPIIAVPTTAGTGSEVTCVSVLTNRALGKKAPIVSDGFFPSVAIIDPELTYSVPPHVTASTGMDVLSQAIEGYWSKGASADLRRLRHSRCAARVQVPAHRRGRTGQRGGPSEDVRGVSDRRAGVHAAEDHVLARLLFPADQYPRHCAR